MTNFHNEGAMFVSSVSLLVKNLDNMVSFYESHLGLILVKKTDTHAFFSANGKDILLKLYTNNNVSDKGNNYGLYYFALLFKDQQSLADVFLNIAKHNYSFSGFSDHGVSEAIYLNDPEGNGIELYYDRPYENWPKDENNNTTMYTDHLDYNKYLIIANEEFKNINPNTILGHIHLYVEDLKTAQEFFIETLGFNMVINYGGSAHFVSTNNYHHHIGYNIWLRGTNYRLENQAGMQGYTIIVKQEHYNNLEKKIKSKNISIGVNEIGQPTIKDINNCEITFLVR